MALYGRIFGCVCIIFINAIFHPFPTASFLTLAVFFLINYCLYREWKMYQESDAGRLFRLVYAESVFYGLFYLNYHLKTPFKLQKLEAS